VLHLYHLSLSQWVWAFPFKYPYTAHAFFLKCLSNHSQCLCCTVSEICPNFNAHLLSDPSWNCIRPDTWLQIIGRRRSACPPRCMKFCILTPKICYYYGVPLHHATTTAEQMAAPLTEIIDSRNMTWPHTDTVINVCALFTSVLLLEKWKDKYIFCLNLQISLPIDSNLWKG
jgi:hypothetical protein